MLDNRDCCMCRVRGCGLCSPVNVCPSGADWITLSLANCSDEGATMLNPGGALFRRDMPGVLAAKPGWPSLELSGASPLADCCLFLCSMRCRCCSLTRSLSSRLCLISGSCVTNPGDKQAIPRSWMPNPPLDVNGRAVAGVLPLVEMVFWERSNCVGRRRALTGGGGGWG